MDAALGALQAVTGGRVWLALQAVAVVVATYVLLDWIKYVRIGTCGRYWPVLGTLPSLAANSTRLAEYAREEFRRQGFPKALCMRASILSPTYIALSTPEDMEYFLKTNFDNYAVSAGTRGDSMTDLFGRGIFNADGDMWFHQRKLASREFNASRFKTFMSQVFGDYAKLLLQRIGEQIPASAKSGVVDIHRWFFVLTLDAFSEIAFGEKIGGMDGHPRPFAASFDAAQQQIYYRASSMQLTWKWLKRFNLGSEREMRAHIKLIDDFVYSLIDTLIARKQSQLGSSWTEGDDLLSRMIPLAEKEDGSYDRVLIRDMLLNLVIAGRDTTAANMSWLAYELSMDPVAQEKIYDEVVSACHGEAVTFDNVANCHYLQAAISEAQRLHPSVPMDPKVALGKDRLPNGVVVAPGDMVILSNYVIGVNPKVWGPDAAAFKPERWLDKEKGTFVKRDQFTFPAFNAGKRLCLGIDMAYLEMRVVIAHLVLNYKWTLVPGQTIVPAQALVLQMQEGLKLELTPRRRPAAAAA